MRKVRETNMDAQFVDRQRDYISVFSILTVFIAGVRFTGHRIKTESEERQNHYGRREAQHRQSLHERSIKSEGRSSPEWGGRRPEEAPAKQSMRYLCFACRLNANCGTKSRCDCCGFVVPHRLISFIGKCFAFSLSPKYNGSIMSLLSLQRKSQILSRPVYLWRKRTRKMVFY